MWVVRDDPYIQNVQTLIVNIALFVDCTACLVWIIRFRIEALAAPFFVETPNFLVWICALVLLILVMSHCCAHDLPQFIEVIVSETEPIHDVLFVFVSRLLGANYVVNPRHLSTDW